MPSDFWKQFSSSLTVNDEWDDVAASRTFDELTRTPLETAKLQARRIRTRLLRSSRYIAVLLKQALMAALVGCVAGLVGSAFQFSMRWASECFLASERLGVSSEAFRIVYLLPLGGLAIVLLYKLARLSVDAGTNQIVDSLTGEKEASLWLAPLIFLSSTITQLFGGSAGREGAALQLGGCVGLGAGRLFGLKDSSLHIAILCGMSGGFAAVFGAPLTAAVFAMEIACVGVVYYPAFLPSLIAASIGSAFAESLGFTVFTRHIPEFSSFSFLLLLRAIALGAACGGVCILFCSTLRKVGQSFSERFPNDYWRVVFGGCCVVVATVLLGTNAYNGTGVSNVLAALDGNARPQDFLLKILFTAVTLGAGFKGGEIVPALAVGSTFGCVAAGPLGILPSQGAALGMIAVFCGATNCPLTSLALSVELFGAENALVFAIVCGVCYLTSGRRGLYRSQTILFSKLSGDPCDARLAKTLLNDLKKLEHKER